MKDERRDAILLTNMLWQILEFGEQSLCIHGSEASNMFLVAVEQSFLFTAN
jgi:hypothetical protein